MIIARNDRRKVSGSFNSPLKRNLSIPSKLEEIEEDENELKKEKK